MAKDIRSVLEARAAVVEVVCHDRALSAKRKAAALSLAASGFYLLPVKGDKAPHTHLVPRGFKDATRDSKKIEEWFKARPDTNIAIACGPEYGLFVIDMDVKNGAPGKESLRKLRSELQPTLIATTPSGGLHLYYKHPRIPLKAKHPDFPGIDFKGATGGGYVLAPPSELPNGSYAWLDLALPISELPESMLARLQDTESLGIPGTLPKALRGLPVESLSQQVQRTIPEGGRHDALVSLAGSLRRKGLTPAAIEAALIEQNGSMCKPPLPDAEVRQIAKSSAKWQPVSDAERGAFPIVLAPLSRDWLDSPPPEQEFAWSPWLPLGSVGLLVGEGGVGKTHLLLRIAAHVAAGQALFGGDVQAGRVVYFGLEDPPAVLRRRVFYLNATMQQHFGEAISNALMDNLVIASMVGQQFHLVTMNGGTVVRSPTVDAVVESIGSARLIVLDPLSRTHGCEENSNSVTTALVNSCERIAQKTGAAVLLGHHTGKAAARERFTDAYAARGGSGLSDATRSVLRLIPAAKADAKGLNLDTAAVERGEYLRLIHAKANYAKTAPPVWLRRLPTGELEPTTPMQAIACGFADLLPLLRKWWVEQWERQPFSRDAVRKQYKTIFGDDVSREQAEAVLDRAIDEGALELSGGTKNPRGRRFTFPQATHVELPAAARADDTGDSGEDTGQHSPPVSEQENDSGGEKTRGGLSPYRPRPVSRHLPNSVAENTIHAETPLEDDEPSGPLDPPPDRPPDGPPNRPPDRPQHRLKAEENLAHK